MRHYDAFEKLWVVYAADLIKPGRWHEPAPDHAREQLRACAGRLAQVAGDFIANGLAHHRPPVALNGVQVDPGLLLIGSCTSGCRWISLQLTFVDIWPAAL